MTIDELETKLNEIDDEVQIHIKKYNPNGGGYYALTINSNFNRYSDRLTIEITNTKKKVLLFSLFKKRYGTTKSWELDTRSNDHTWIVKYMDFYLKALKIAQQFMEENNGKKPSIDIGVRGTLKDFKNAYTVEFLGKYGYKEYSYRLFNPKPIILAKTIKTKYGELVIHNNSVITYVGDGIWSVSRDEIQH
ncbi:hypothetical protein [Lactobacillus helveticus]|uniref:hypothetical protein n=1 Tax=Lactobacillus helveticus TaxID=1587 RepID=UPI001561D0C3|nr:hypothetical protein [Lactobacillus helveticus]NRO27724.1 hypothetical protein [Lactobacillus helveticus]